MATLFMTKAQLEAERLGWTLIQDRTDDPQALLPEIIFDLEGSLELRLVVQEQYDSAFYRLFLYMWRNEGWERLLEPRGYVDEPRLTEQLEELTRIAQAIAGPITPTRRETP